MRMNGACAGYSLTRAATTSSVCRRPVHRQPDRGAGRGEADKDEYQGGDPLFLDVNAGVNEVNFFNRLHFFASQAKEAATAATIF